MIFATQKTPIYRGLFAFFMTLHTSPLVEVTPGFEPGMTVLQTVALPLGYVADGAENGTRTRDPHLGKVVLYQLSYFRKNGDPNGT